MFIKDLRKDFYEKVVKSKVLVLVSCDTDAICALKILQFLFETDNVQYTVIPVTTVEDVIQKFQTHRNNIQALVLINAGCTFDVIEDLDIEPESGICVYVADSHRPVNHFNIFRDDQIFLLMNPSDNQIVPAYEDVINEDSDSDDEDEDVDPRKLSMEELERRQAKRFQRQAWARRAQKLIDDYYRCSYFGDSVAELLFNLAWKLSRDSNQLLWYAIVGVFDQHVNGKIDTDKFVGCVARLQNHVSRLSHLREERATGVLSELNSTTGDAATSAGQSDNSTASQQIKNQALSLSYAEDLQLVLYRHWSIYESMRHTMKICSRFLIWTPRGHKQLLEFLAELGIPLTQSKQKFNSMEMEYKKNLQEWIEGLVEKYKLENVIGSNFLALKGYKFKYSAADVALAVRAILESADKDKSSNDKFLEALDSLSWSKTEILETGIEVAKTQLIAILRQVQHILDLHNIHKAGPFLYCILKEETPDVKMFCYPAILTNLSHFLLNAFVSKTKIKDADLMPLILIVADLNQPGTGLITGIPPLKSPSPRNDFATVFKQLHEFGQLKFSVVSELYDKCVARMPFNDKTCSDVITSLTVLMTTNDHEEDDDDEDDEDDDDQD